MVSTRSLTSLQGHVVKTMDRWTPFTPSAYCKETLSCVYVQYCGSKKNNRNALFCVFENGTNIILIKLKNLYLIYDNSSSPYKVVRLLDLERSKLVESLICKTTQVRKWKLWIRYQLQHQAVVHSIKLPTAAARDVWNFRKFTKTCQFWLKKISINTD